MWKTWLTPLSQHPKGAIVFGDLDEFVALTAPICTKRRFALYKQLGRDGR